MYAKLIFDGKKRVEYRRIIPLQPFDKVLVYSSSPVCKIVGEFNANEVISDTIEGVWEITKDLGCLDLEKYLSYFKGKSTANAIKVSNPKLYSQNRKLSDYKIARAPQNFCYIKN